MQWSHFAQKGQKSVSIIRVLYSHTALGRLQRRSSGTSSPVFHGGSLHKYAGIRANVRELPFFLALNPIQTIKQRHLL